MAEGEGITGARADAIELLTSDHRVVEQLFRQLEGAGPDTKAARYAAEQIVRELSIHAVIEEQVLYPVIREALPDGESLVEEHLREHQEMKELLTDVDGKGVDEPNVLATFQRLKTAVEHHVSEEEGQVFPSLHGKVGEERLMQMGEAMEKAKSAAPTHPHPHAPDTPPGNLIAGLAAAAMDKIRDAARQVMNRNR